MPSARSRKLAASLAAIAFLAGSTGFAVKEKKRPLPGTMDANTRIVHALDRFTFGPRPGDLERVRQVGLEDWFEQQLHPDSIPDLIATQKIAGFRTLTMSTRELAESYPSPQMVRQLANGKMAMPLFDSGKRAIYASAVDRYRRKQAAKQQGDTRTSDHAAEAKRPRTTPEDPQAGRASIDVFLAKSPDERYKMVLALPDPERIALFRALSPQERQQVLAQFTPAQREEVIALTVNPGAVVTTELLQAKLFRETYSERQLQEVMTDFWLNHFNVFINKNQERYLVPAYERDAIRPYALGKFKDLLLATAKSPAMLFYLDNAESIGPHSDFALNGGREPATFRRARFAPHPQNKAKKLSGLNENYAREIMELHTLGVAGGYTQRDVTELAKVFSGWTITPPRSGNMQFEYRPEYHEPGEKIVLGYKFKRDGEKEGWKALEMLAHNPATANFISKKIALRFVSDDLPPALVERMAQTFLRTDGDIKEVLRTLFRSPEFWSQEAYRAKIKTPLEFVVSGLRATNADVENAQPLAAVLAKMGMPLYGMQPPTGYSMKADDWINSSALLARLNFSLALAAGKFPGTIVDAAALDGNAQHPNLDALATQLLAAGLSPQTNAAIEREIADPARTQPPRALAVGLILGSPEFQRR